MSVLWFATVTQNDRSGNRVSTQSEVLSFQNPPPEAVGGGKTGNQMQLEMKATTELEGENGKEKGRTE